MKVENIWTNLNFSDSIEESAYDLLLTQSKNLAKVTENELKMDIEAVDSYLEVVPPKPIAVYMLYVVAPKLGNFRRKILTVIEGKEDGRFPVEIFCHIDETKSENIDKEKFIATISEIIHRIPVKHSIENLYKQSKQYTNNNYEQ